MSVFDEIFKTLEDSAKESENEETMPDQRRPAPKTIKKAIYKKGSGFLEKKPREFDMVGYTIGWPPINWDDLGLGLVRAMGFVHNRPVKLSFRDGVWSISGPYANSTVLWFIFAGGASIVYFLRDIIFRNQEWGSMWGSLIPVVFSLLGLLFRKKTLEFQPYELEMLAYDSENHVLVMSTLTQPGGVIALRPELPADKDKMKAAEVKLATDLRKVHNGFFFVDGLAKPDMSSIKSWSLWALVSLIIGYYSYRYFS